MRKEVEPTHWLVPIKMCLYYRNMWFGPESYCSLHLQSGTVYNVYVNLL